MYLKCMLLALHLQAAVIPFQIHMYAMIERAIECSVAIFFCR